MEAIGAIKRGSAFAGALVALLFVAVPATAMADWRPAGNPVTQSRSPLRGYDLKRIGGVPYVAWSESNGRNYVIQVARLAPGSGKWVRIGPGPLNHDATKNAETPSLAAGPGGVPWVAWAEPDRGGVKQIRAARLSPDGSRWIEPDSRDFAINFHPKPNEPFGAPGDRSIWYADSPRLTFFGSTPYITFLQDNPVEYEVDVVRLAGRGNGWERVSRGVPGMDTPRDARAAIFGNALFAGATNGFAAAVISQRSGGSWHSLDEMANKSVDGTPMGALNDVAGFDDEPYVIWSAGSVYVSRFSGGAWHLAGGGPVGEGAGSSIRVIGGRLYAVWTGGGDVHVSRLADDRKSWVGTPGALNTSPVAPNQRTPVLDRPALTGIDGTPNVAFSETADGVTALRVASLDGAPTPAGADDGDGSDLSATPPAGDDQSSDGDNGSQPPARGPCGPNLIGTAGADSIRGTAGRDTIRGLGGNDILKGLAGNDCLFGGVGNDFLDGGAGADVLHGGPGNDVLRGGAGGDRLYGDAGNDHLYGGPGNDLLVGGPGNDVLVGGGGWDRFKAGPGNDVIYAADGRGETVDCGRGIDTAYADRFDRLHGCERVKIVR